MNAVLKVQKNGKITPDRIEDYYKKSERDRKKIFSEYKKSVLNKAGMNSKNINNALSRIEKSIDKDIIYPFSHDAEKAKQLIYTLTFIKWSDFIN